MSYDHILAIDPSGNFEEGKGTTGTCLFDCRTNKILNTVDISAKNFNTKEEYWQKHVEYIAQVCKEFDNTVIVIEDFTLDPRRAMQQSHSKMETPKLIGILQLHCKQHSVPYYMQRPVEVKNRWADHILEYKGYLIKKHRMYYISATAKYPISRHCKDAIRHAVHYYMFHNDERYTM